MLYEVTLTIPDLYADSPEEAATVFAQIIRTHWAGLLVECKDEDETVKTVMLPNLEFHA